MKPLLAYLGGEHPTIVILIPQPAACQQLVQKNAESWSSFDRLTDKTTSTTSPAGATALRTIKIP